MSKVRQTTEKLSKIHYSAESPLRQPGLLISHTFKNIWHSRELAYTLFMRDLKSGFRQTYLGYAWLFLPLLGTTFVWFFLNSQKIVNIAETPVPYAAFVMVGSIIWQTFTSSLSQPLQAFNSGKSVFMKLNVAPEAFMIAGIGKIIFDLVLKTSVLVPVFIILKIVPASTAWLFPVGLVCTVMVGTAIGVLLVPVGSLYDDIPRIVGQGVSVLMYMTPVVYPPPASGFAAFLIRYNPLTPIVMAPRQWLTVGMGEYTDQFVLLSLAALIVLFAALLIFRITLPRLVERMGM